MNDDLHVEITAFAPPSEAHARIAYALTEVRKYLIPDANDQIRQQQMREMELINNKNININNTSTNVEDIEVERSEEEKSSIKKSPPNSNAIALRGLITNKSC